MELLLLSGGLLNWYTADLKIFLKKHNIKKTLFIPYAGFDLDHYTERMRNFFTQECGVELVTIHALPDKVQALKDAEVVFVGGGNTFRLLLRLYELGLIDILKQRVKEGMPYIGASACINITGQTIGTTNDMPIVFPPTLTALKLLHCNLNPHYLDPDSNSSHKGETREQRIEEFHEENSLPVIGVREKASLYISNNQIKVLGERGVRVFERNKSPKEYKTGETIKLW